MSEVLRPRQADVLRLLCQGLQNKEVAYTLGITERSIEIHRRIIMQSIGAKSAVQLGVWAQVNGYGQDSKPVPAIGSNACEATVGRRDAACLAAAAGAGL